MEPPSPEIASSNPLNLSEIELRTVRTALESKQKATRSMPRKRWGSAAGPCTGSSRNIISKKPRPKTKVERKICSSSRSGVHGPIGQFNLDLPYFAHIGVASDAGEG